jgi:7-cyano-7-deazaguanine synthase
MKKAILALSGGLDSATLLGLLLSRGYEVHCCIYTYGSKHNEYENRAAFKLYHSYKEAGFQMIPHMIDLEQIFRLFNSNLLKSGGAIPEGHYESESMKLTVVPGRNLIFASIMAGLAESIGAEIIALGVHAGDHAIYPDCRPDFISMLRTTIQLSSDNKVEVYTPFLDFDKSQILHKGKTLIPPVPYELTRTCYKNQAEACGKCGSCVERLEAFKKLNLKDPVKYE